MNSQSLPENLKCFLRTLATCRANRQKRVSSSRSAFGELGVCAKKAPKCACRSMLPDMPERSPSGTRRSVVVFFAMAQEQKLNKQDQAAGVVYIINALLPNRLQESFYLMNYLSLTWHCHLIFLYLETKPHRYPIDTLYTPHRHPIYKVAVHFVTFRVSLTQSIASG